MGSIAAQFAEFYLLPTVDLAVRLKIANSMSTSGRDLVDDSGADHVKVYWLSCILLVGHCCDSVSFHHWTCKEKAYKLVVRSSL